MSNTLRPFVLLFILGATTSTRPGMVRGDDLAKAIELRQVKLTETRKFGGFDDPHWTLEEVLQQLSKTQHVTIDLNEKAFASEKDAFKDVRNTPILEASPIPSFKGTLSSMLKKILERIPSKSGATFIVRGDTIEITTRAAVIEEFYWDRADVGAELPPLVHAAIVKKPISVALREMAKRYGVNVLVDVRVAEEAATIVTADFTNVPIDNAVRLLADMAGLTMVKIGNVIYVTSKKNGKALQQVP